MQQPIGVFITQKGKHIITASVAAIGLLPPLASHAIDPAYAKKLEQSGCTQITETKGFDINKSKAENAKAGFGTAATTTSPYAGQWVAKNIDGRTVSTIRIDSKGKAMVNGKSVANKLTDSALVFKSGFITYTIQGDPRLTNEK